MYFSILIMEDELNCLEETAYTLMRKEHVRKTDRKIIVESFKGIKRKLRKIKGHEFYIMVGCSEYQLPNPIKLGLKGFSWNVGDWSLVFFQPREELSPIESFLETEINWENVIDYECSWSPK